MAFAAIQMCDAVASDAIDNRQLCMVRFLARLRTPCKHDIAAVVVYNRDKNAQCNRMWRAVKTSLKCLFDCFNCISTP